MSMTKRLSKVGVLRLAPERGNKMRAKKEFFFLFIVIIALIFYLIFRNTNRTYYELPLIPEVAGKDISKIEISKSDTSIVLNKKDIKWCIEPEEYPADESKIENMLKVIEAFELTTLVSEKKTDHLFDLTDDKKITIKVWTDGNCWFSFKEI